VAGSSEVDGGGNNGVGELSSARTTIAGVPQVIREYERMSAVQVVSSCSWVCVFVYDLLSKRPL
jgi:hypothetical protein